MAAKFTYRNSHLASGFWLLASGFWLLAAILMVFAGRRYGEECLAWISINKLPEGRLRRSFLAVAVTLTTLEVVVLACGFLSQAFTHQRDVSDDVRSFVNKLFPFQGSYSAVKTSYLHRDQSSPDKMCNFF
ncbi:hypothetical protein VC191_09570 [Citrobacter koseri]|uniref:hypothetical protein n=1 Tax=Citrobacter koseri TaxID=545 RepID=UPI002B368C8F|nr:hypothetical protein [Citrobacter koseri]MEB2704042.1 hypothetical protein [Citrobacter koseri]MEB2709577.1 hypothetical protein [Citrobacter koseri]